MPSRTPETWTHGAVLLDSEHTRFALWAPDAFYVSVEIDTGESIPMLPQAKPDSWSRLVHLKQGELPVFPVEKLPTAIRPA